MAINDSLQDLIDKRAARIRSQRDCKHERTYETYDMYRKETHIVVVCSNCRWIISERKLSE